MEIAEKRALITGAGRGIGQTTAVTLARSGASIIGIDLHAAGLDETAAVVRQLGAPFEGHVCDITDAEASAALLQKTAAAGGFDILINNAGVMAYGPFGDGRFSEWERVIDINLTSLMRFTFLALPQLMQRPRAHIVNLGSVAGKFGSEGLVAYAASKHGVVGFSSALREELAPAGVGVSWICPSIVDTRMTSEIPAHFFTPRLSREAVAQAIQRAIERNQSEIFVPRGLRFTVAILPNVFPNFARQLSRWTRASQAWLKSRKPLEI